MYYGDIDELAEKTKRILTKGLLEDYRKPGYYSAAYGTRRYNNETEEHLINCKQAVAFLHEANDGFYGCETGCEYYTLKGVITCPHGYADEYDASGFGDLDWVFKLEE